MNATAKFIQDALVLAFGDFIFTGYLDAVNAPENLAVLAATSFEDAKVVTSVAGLILTMEDGSTFQLSITQRG